MLALPDPRATFGRYIRLLRYNRKLGLNYMAKALGINMRTYMRIEKGTLAPPRFEALMRWLDVLDAVEPLTDREITLAIFRSWPRWVTRSGDTSGPAGTLALWMSPVARRWFRVPQVTEETKALMKEIANDR